ncbi:MAG TPA: hypothetical protein VK446_00360 [Methylocystis sp.]|nr:hypothetical protein [Methylocystis sp.]HXZ16563.1 hypothetical protein [Roseiarcus sp.]
MRKFARIGLTALGALALPIAATEARAEIDVRPDGLRHYSNCIAEAKERATVYVLDRHVLYRCGDETATSYFNYLAEHRRELHERRVRDKVVDEPTGTFVYRTIDGVGRCWNKIADEFGAPISVYGCDVYVKL